MAIRKACFARSAIRSLGPARLIALADGRLNQENRSFAIRRARGFAALFLLLSIAGGVAYLFSLGLAGLELPRPASSSAHRAYRFESHRATQPRCPCPCRRARLLPSGLAAGRAAAAKIVGRDVAKLDEAGVARAAIESLAENFSDGVVAPAFWLALGGLPGGVATKRSTPPTAWSVTARNVMRRSASPRRNSTILSIFVPRGCRPA